MTELVDIKYVGKKPFALDNVAGSGKLWNGNGDVQTVTANQAKILLKYPDQWALANAEDATMVDQPVTIEVETGTDDQGQAQVEQVDTESLGKPLERMTKPELVAFAKVKFNADLDVSKGKKALIDQIEELMNPVVQ